MINTAASLELIACCMVHWYQGLGATCCTVTLFRENSNIYLAKIDGIITTNFAF
jgi:hypothetical protein